VAEKYGSEIHLSLIGSQQSFLLVSRFLPFSFCFFDFALAKNKRHNNSYRQEIPTRFKKDMVSQCSKAKDSGAVGNMEELLQNIGVFGEQVTHDDVECIVSEFGEDEKDATISADRIISKIL
jgi:hypothetical protein